MILATLEVIAISSFRLILEFSETISSNSFASSGANDNTLNALNWGKIADLPLLKTLQNH